MLPVVHRGDTEPALEGPVEGALFRIAQIQGDLVDRAIAVHEPVAGQAAAFVFQQAGKIRVFRAQLAAQGPGLDRQLIGNGLQLRHPLLQAFLDAARDTRDGWQAIATAVSVVDAPDMLRDIGRIYQRQNPQDQQAFREAANETGLWSRLEQALPA